MSSTTESSHHQLLAVETGDYDPAVTLEALRNTVRLLTRQMKQFQQHSTNSYAARVELEEGVVPQLKAANKSLTSGSTVENDQLTVETEDFSCEEEENSYGAAPNHEFARDALSVSPNRSRTLSAQSLEDDLQFAQVTHDVLLQIPQVASEILALQNAARMLQEHARLASEEASTNAQDNVQLQEQVCTWKERALSAERENVRLAQENTVLQDCTHKLKKERKILVKEVRSLRQNIKEKEKKDTWQQIESYVTGALSFHEGQLRRDSRSPSPKNEVSLSDLNSSSSTGSSAVDVNRDTFIDQDKIQGQVKEGKRSPSNVCHSILSTSSCLMDSVPEEDNPEEEKQQDEATPAVYQTFSFTCDPMIFRSLSMPLEEDA